MKNLPQLHQYSVRLNFVSVRIPPFVVFRKEAAEGEERPDGASRRYSLPLDPRDVEKRGDYWVRTDEKPGWQKYHCAPKDNVALTVWLLHRSLLASLLSGLGDSRVVERPGIQPEISVAFSVHTEGIETLVLQALYLHRAQEFGFCANFRLRKAPDQPFSRRVQQLSLSLTAHGRRNLDACADRWRKIESFIRNIEPHTQSFTFFGADEAAVANAAWTSLSANILHPRTFVFSGGRKGTNAFTGVKDHGPLATPAAPVHLLFLFEERHRPAARDLVAAIRGSSGLAAPGYPGFESFFRHKLEIDASPIVVGGFKRVAIEAAVAAAAARRKPGTVVVAVGDEDDQAYCVQKALFTQAAIPTQYCIAETIADRVTLKWSIANIALQIFAKAGGVPWHVQPSVGSALIVGVSQAHQTTLRDGIRSVSKYFAFSILTDTTGAFHSITTLADRTNRESYLADLAMRLQQVLSDESAGYERVVLHATHKMKNDEMQKIEGAVRAVASHQRNFSILRVNTDSQFFGANEAENSLVPYESTAVALGGRKSLIWFEGVQSSDPTVRKVYPGPTLVEVMRDVGPTRHSEDDLLQELIDLSGTNWRGFNAKSVPTSIYYCQLVADMMQQFYSRGLPVPTGEIKSPWFL